MRAKLKEFCMHSLTIAWSYILAVTGAILQVIDGISDALNDPAIKDQLSASIGDPKALGRILLGISIITFLARLRSLRKAV